MHYFSINKFSKSLNSYIVELSSKLIFQGVCQPILKIFGDPLPVWGNPNLNFNHCPWCISIIQLIAIMSTVPYGSEKSRETRGVHDKTKD